MNSKIKPLAMLLASMAAGLGVAPLASAGSITLDVPPAWARPIDAATAASTLTVHAEWDGFATTDATNAPTGVSQFGAGLTTPVAGDSTPSATDGAFIIPSGTANNTYYSNVTTGDIYSPGASITPRVSIPGYNIPGNQLNVKVQAESWGSAIDSSKLTVNGISFDQLANHSVTETYTDGGMPFGGFGTAFRNDYAWTFTLPADTNLTQLDFGWGASSASLVSLVVDTQSTAAPEPASLGILGGGAGLLLLARRRRQTA